MALVQNFKAASSVANTVELNWKQPVNFNNESDEIVVTRTITHYPTELFNSSFPNKATDSRPVEIFRGSTITGLDVGTISVVGNVLTDSAAAFPINPGLKGRLFRDDTGKVFVIQTNTSTSITLDSSPSNGKYVVLADFPTEKRVQQNFQNNLDTTSGAGYVTNLIELIDGNFSLANFQDDELVNLFFRDSANNLFLVKSNTLNTLYFFENTTPVIGTGMALLSSYTDSNLKNYIDTFLNDVEANARTGTGLQDNQFYYYTAFTIPVNVNVAQAEFSDIDSGTSTQASAISIQDRDWGNKLYNYWPSVARELDANEDLQDLMEVFGYQFAELHALVETYRLQDTHTLFSTAVLALAEQTGLPTVSYSIGVDTLRRISADMLTAWKLKGSKEGIAQFIRIITTWDITGGTGDFENSIIDFLPNVAAFRFFDPALGSANSRFTVTDPYLAGGRFARALPGVVIPGFFNFREFVILVPDVALFVGNSTNFTTSMGTNTMYDSLANFGPDDSLIGNYLLPNQEELNDLFVIVGNTSTSITVKGAVDNKTPGGRYCVLSPLNANRFLILNKLMPVYIPFKTKAGYSFT